MIINEHVNYLLSWSVLTTRTGVLCGPYPFTVDAKTVILYSTYSLRPVISLVRAGGLPVTVTFPL